TCGPPGPSGRASTSSHGRSPDRGRPACGRDANPAGAGSREVSLGHLAFLDLDQVADLVDHSANLRTVLVLDGLIQTAKAERLHGALLIGLLPDHAAHVGDLQPRHAQPTGSSAGTSATTGAASASGFLPRRPIPSTSPAGFPAAL